MLLKTATALLGLLSLAGAAQAQTKMTPGLWEQEMTMKGGGGSGGLDAQMAAMQQQLAAMPPEKRAQLEAMMAQRGISMAPAGAGTAVKMKVCITPEQSARDQLAHQEQGSCRQTSQTRSGNTVKVTMECTGRMQGKGEGEFTFISPKEHQGKMNMTMSRGEQTGSMDMQFRSRWLAADCGDVKPRP